LKIIEDYKKLGINAEYKKNNNLKFNEFGYIEIFGMAKFNAIKYATSLAQIAVKNGVIINENTEVIDLNDKKDFVEIKILSNEIIKAKKVISATYIPFGKSEYLEHKYNMYRSYVVEYKIDSNTLLEGTYQDTLKPYHYFRVDKENDFDRLIIGGADNLEILNVDTLIGEKLIQNYALDFFKINNLREIRHWSGMISEPATGLASIGESKGGNIFYAFGFSGNGLTYSYIASRIFTDQINSEDNPYSKIYSIDNKFTWWKKLFL
jgi:glycine/D-amino acid oxidase-like deaminating enzyme